MDGSQRAIAREVERRRTFAIISHPDAGKTTLTEKLLLFGGALREAGAVRAQKAARHATSDWLELEKQRGISVSSSVSTVPLIAAGPDPQWSLNAFATEGAQRTPAEETEGAQPHAPHDDND